MTADVSHLKYNIREAYNKYISKIKLNIFPNQLLSYKVKEVFFFKTNQILEKGNSNSNS